MYWGGEVWPAGGKAGQSRVSEKLQGFVFIAPAPPPSLCLLNKLLEQEKPMY